MDYICWICGNCLIDNVRYIDGRGIICRTCNITICSKLNARAVLRNANPPFRSLKYMLLAQKYSGPPKDWYL